MTDLCRKLILTDVGYLTLLATVDKMVGVRWGDIPCDAKPASGAHALLEEAARQINEYMGGRRQKFELQYVATGTAFQMAVWSALEAIPFGETRTYGDVAEVIGKPKAVRAVGSACRANPIGLIIPCHRVVAASGQVAGFAGGKEAKAHLLSHESRQTREEANRF